MKRYHLLFIPLLFLLGCRGHKASKYPGYTTQNEIEYYKYADIENSHRKAGAGDVMEVNLNYCKMNDSLFWDSHDAGFPFVIFIPYDTLKAGASYRKILLICNEGDSINIIVPAEDMFRQILHNPLPYFLHKNNMVKVNTRIVSIMNTKQYAKKIKEIKETGKDLDIEEQLTLLHYVTAHNISQSEKKDDIYFIPEKEGSGPDVKEKSQVSIAYSGYFLNGRRFDSISPLSPLQFRLGDTAQVIAGIEIGIKRMREGGKAKIIIPSQLAFGENGSSTGIVPPYTSVIYEVTMLKVSDPGK